MPYKKRKRFYKRQSKPKVFSYKKPQVRFRPLPPPAPKKSKLNWFQRRWGEWRLRDARNTKWQAPQFETIGGLGGTVAGAYYGGGQGAMYGGTAGEYLGKKIAKHYESKADKDIKYWENYLKQ